MKPGLALLLLLSIRGGCGEGKTSSPDAGASASASEAAPRRLSPAVIEGILPPPWHVGDTWRVSAREPSSLEGFGHLAFLEYDYRVKAVPASKGGEYVIEAGTRKRWDSVMTFRTDDFWFAACACSSLDKLEADRAGSAGPAVPFISSPMFNPAIIFPAVRATMENPLFFATERGSPMAKTVAVQLVEPLPGGLHIVIQERNEYAIHTHEMLWRRGDPWWSKARSWSVGLIEDLPGDKPQVWLEWEAHLELPDDDAAPMVWPWEPAHWKWPIPEHYP